MPKLPTSSSTGNPAFELEVGPHSKQEFTVLSFDAIEGISKPFSADVLVESKVELDTKGILGESGQLWMHLHDGTMRLLNGIVAQVDSWARGEAPEAIRYRVRLAPKLWKLSHIHQSRIFQAKAAPEIVAQVLKEANIAHELRLSGKYQSREYCVQYRESDLNFVSRLMEEEGIFYFFEFGDAVHTLVLADGPSASQSIDGQAELPYGDGAGMVAESESIGSLHLQREVRPGQVVLRDYNFLRPTMDLEGKAKNDDGGGEDSDGLEVYEYPGKFGHPDLGAQRAKVRLEAIRALANRGKGTSNCPWLLPGRKFTLEQHPLAELNQEYLVLGVHHQGRHSSKDASANSGDEKAPSRYLNRFACLPFKVPYRHPDRARRPVIPGPQTAMVVGPAGEEIHTDEHGRIKVQFHWDREGKKDDRSSCWMRVAQSWAGAGWGSVFLPRVGHEVVVEFLEGDPDRPLVVGSVYNGMNVTPVVLPDSKTESSLPPARALEETASMS